MFSKRMLRSAISVSGVVFAVVIFIGLSVSISMAVDIPDELNKCGDNEDFTTEFRLEDCKFKAEGSNPYFILKPGYQWILEGEEEDGTRVGEEITVLCETKWINLDGRKIKTRVVEERALEWDDEEGEWVTIEISRNYYAICKRTNDAGYFGEFSRDCPDGFDESDVCTGDESMAGSWEAGVNNARPGLIMPGTFLLGSKYFQEIALIDKAVDRAEHVAMGLDVEVPAGNWSDCVQVIDTNPAVGECEDEDAKTYCPGIGKVIDADLKLVSYGFVGCDDDDADDGEHRRRWRGFWPWTGH